MDCDLDSCLERSLPVRDYSGWVEKGPPDGPQWKKVSPFQLVSELVSLVCQHPGREISGALGPDWVSWSEGTPDASRVDSEASVTWHSHPPGLPFFSVEDWLAFSISRARASVLVWGSEAAVYVREGKSAIAEVKPSLFSTYPELSLQGFARQIGMSGDIRPAGLNAARRDAGAAKRLGVERHALTD